MATITQINPVSDTVSTGLSESYLTQLNATGGTPPYTWVVTSVADDLAVSSSGAVTTTGTLNSGAYFISGTFTDSVLNVGTWSFSLQVVSPVSPGTGVTPVQPALPTGVEILVPFQIDPATGGVAVISSYNAILAQHIETIVLTSLNERVMNPAYGYGLERQVFTPIGSGLPSLMQSDVSTAIKKWEPRVNVLAVNVAHNPLVPGLLTVNVDFSVNPFNDVNTVTVSAGGTIAQVN